MALKRSFPTEWDRDAIQANAATGVAFDEDSWPIHRLPVPDRPGSVAAALLIATPPVAENDFDRPSGGIATGNVVTGLNTLSGAAGKDHGGSGALSIPGIVGTFSLTYGDVTLDNSGNYTYTRTVAIDLLPVVGAIDTFTYEVADSKGQMSNTATMTFYLDPLITTAVAPQMNGTDYDDFIRFKTPGYGGIVNGLGGDDIIQNLAVGVGIRLDGGAGDDVLTGNNSADILVGGPGADKISGGFLEGGDVVSYETLTKDVALSLETGFGTLGDALGDFAFNMEDINGGKGNDTLTGDLNKNVLQGGAGNDTLSGGRGNNDALSGDAGNDTLDGETGNDSLHGGAGNDNLSGGDGNDALVGDAGADHLDGGAGLDVADYSNSSTAVLVDTDHPTKSTGDAKGDTYTSIEAIYGSIFNDTFIAGPVQIDLHGAAGDDKVIGGVNADRLFGDGGNDTLSGADGDDALNGGLGNDILVGGGGADTFDGGADIDYASYATAKAAVAVDISFGGLAGDALGDIFVNVEGLIGSAFADSFFGNANADTFFGGAGNDQLFGQNNFDKLIGGAGADTLDGGADFDTASYLGSAALTVNLADPSKSTGDAKGDIYISIELIEGSAFADTLTGDGSANFLAGGLGADKMAGGGGNDSLSGNDGNDVLNGEAGDDAIRGGVGLDKIDGGVGSDLLVGDDGNDTLLGGDDADNLSGSLGDDKLDGGAGADSLLGDEGKDSLTGGDGDDFLYGGTENDILLGGNGGDELNGGAGNDTLTGGAGADIFVAGPGTDKVTDFNRAEDFIKLTGVINGAGDTVEDLLDAGFAASTSGTTLTISRDGAAEMVISGWTGGQILGDMQTLVAVLDTHLVVTA